MQAEIENRAGRLRPEMFGSIRHAHGVAPVPAIPATAVVEMGGRTVVVVEEAPGKFRTAEIAAGGRRDDEMVAVLSGIKPGERIVVDGAILLRSR